jgi:hypothetical protein
MVIGSFFFITKLGKNRENSYKEFLLNSPGKEIDINGQ